MKILFMMEHLYPVQGGAEHSIATLISELEKSKEHQVDHLCTMNFKELLLDSMINYDVIVTQLQWAPNAIQLAKILNKKSVLFIRSFETLCSSAAVGQVLSHCQQKCYNCPSRLKIDPMPDSIISNSKYTQNLLLTEHGIPSEVIYPFIDFSTLESSAKPKKYITMNQFAYHKGVDIFIRIAEQMPQYLFQIVGYECWDYHKPLPPNIYLTGKISPSEIYAETSIFLAPARWNETFGRTLIEAQYLGIPVISSNRGAASFDELVPEEQRVQKIDMIPEWIEKIEMIMANYPAYSAKTKGLDLSRYNLKRNVEEFKRIISQLNASKNQNSSIQAGA